MRHPPPKKALGKPQTAARKSRELTDQTKQQQPVQTDLKQPDTHNWLTRNETSDMLQCSVQTLKNYEAQGKLHPRHAWRKDPIGAERVMLVYDPQELAKLPPRRTVPRELLREPGEQAAKVFELLRKGLALDEIVIETRETPDMVDHLNDRWLEQTKARHVITPEAKKAFEEIVGPFEDVTALVKIVAEKTRYAVTPAMKERFERIVGPFQEVTELVELVENKLTVA